MELSKILLYVFDCGFSVMLCTSPTSNVIAKTLCCLYDYDYFVVCQSSTTIYLKIAWRYQAEIIMTQSDHII